MFFFIFPFYFMNTKNYLNNLSSKTRDKFKKISLTAWVMLCLCLSPNKANSQTKIKELFENFSSFNKEIKNVKKATEVSPWIYRDEENNLISFKKMNIIALYHSLTPTELKKDEYMEIESDKGNRFVKYTDIDFVYNNFKEYKDKIISISMHEEAETTDDFIKLIIKYNWQPIFLSDIKNGGYVHLKNEEEIGNFHKLFSALKALPEDEKALIVLNKDASFWGIFFIKPKELEENSKRLEEYLKEVKQKVDSVDVSEYTTNGYKFENATEEQIAKIYYYIVSNYSYCYKCLEEYSTYLWNNGIDILKSNLWICDAYAKAFTYIAQLYDIDVKREIGVMDLFWTSWWNHAWNSSIINGKKYYFDATNEKVISEGGKMKKFGATNLYKIPEKIWKIMLIPWITKAIYNSQEKRPRKEIIEENKDIIIQHKKENLPYIIHYIHNFNEKENKKE